MNLYLAQAYVLGVTFNRIGYDSNSASDDRRITGDCHVICLFGDSTVVNFVHSLDGDVGTLQNK